MARSATIDAVNDVLIVIVIVGHVFVESVSSNVFKWGVCSFHMPLFLGLSGILVSYDRIKSESCHLF